MNRERYQRVGELYHATLELAPDKRAAFLDTACGGDLELRREVESLIHANDAVGDFIAAPAASVVGGARAATPASPAAMVHAKSSRAGAYEIVSLIGRGGMGEVHLAHDSRLNRKAAIKFLHAELTSNPDAVRRFEPATSTIDVSSRWNSSRVNRYPRCWAWPRALVSWRRLDPRSRGPSPWRTPPASSIATSSPRTSCAARTAT
jgi:serine/threonine protein kinase